MASPSAPRRRGALESWLFSLFAALCCAGLWLLFMQPAARATGASLDYSRLWLPAAAAFLAARIACLLAREIVIAGLVTAPLFGLAITAWIWTGIATRGSVESGAAFGMLLTLFIASLAALPFCLVCTALFLALRAAWRRAFAARD